MKRPPCRKRGLKIESLESRLALAVDLAVDVGDGDIEAHPGDTVVYRLEYANRGDTDATGVTLGDLVLPRASFNAEASTEGWDCGEADGPAFIHCKLSVGDLAAGETGVAELAVDVPGDSGGGNAFDLLSNIRAAHLLWNFARIHDDGANGRDANPRNNHDVERTPVIRPRIVADLKVSISDGDATAAPGGSVQYTIDYANGGTGDATGVVIRQTLPAFTRFDPENSSEGWTCRPQLTANAIGNLPFGHGATCTLEVGDLAAGDEASATLGVTVAAEVPRHVRQLTTSSTISMRGFHIDPTPQNNFDSEQTPVEHPPVMAPDLSITSDDGDVTVGPGDTLTYTLSYANNGTAEATGVVLTEIVPAFTRFNAEASSEGWRCSNILAAAGVNSALLPATCILEVGTLAPNATGTATFAVTVAERLPSTLRAIRNVARIRDDGSHGRDPNQGNNIAVNETPIERPAPEPMVANVRR